MPHPRASAAAPGPLPRLVATDLDGTLLRDDHTVSPRTVAALEAAEAAGIEVVFVTGRPARWMDAVRPHAAGHSVAICANGAAEVDLHRDGTLLDVRPLHDRNALAIVHALRRAVPGVSFAVERTTGIHYEPAYPPLHLDPASDVAAAEKLLSPGPPYDGAPVLKLLAHHTELDPDAFLALARETAGRHGEFTRSSPTSLLEISGPGVSKASALSRRCAARGIRPEEVVAFGDMPNDLQMLAWAGAGYAMANAHPAVLAATPRRAPSNQEDGVAQIIETLLA